ncbi:MAG: tetratricopeptide repeat protein [Candidatus Symbiothrix sp.]|jgi:tetratricopeptide (TPR) repeat protein|nr:tetratricopeptide repeat protein [Candidatus Symbiothrix sp.]
MKKIGILAVSMLLSAVGVSAASNERGIDLYRAELFDAAKIEFLGQTGGTPTEQAERYYYLGQTYSELQKPDSSAYYYAQAVSIDPNYPFGYIGQGELELSKGNLKAAEDLFKQANGLAKKDPSVQTSIAESYIEYDKNTEAEAALVKARKADKKFPGLYVAEGDAIAKGGLSKVGEAAGSYEQALLFDPNYKIALLKLARIYKTVNPSESLKYLDQLVSLDPNYIPAYALIGDINRSLGQYNKALDAYQKFIAIPGVPTQQREYYAQLLYFTDQYDKSLEEIKLVLAQYPNNVVMHRLQAYNDYKLGNYAAANAEMTQFLKDTPADQHIYLDYSTYSNILLKEKQPEAAIAALQKALELAVDKDKAGVYRDLASAYESAKNYPAAIEHYQKYFTTAENPGVLDYHWYGMANYYAAAQYSDGTGDETEFQSYIDNGTKAFSEVIERSPESYLGYLTQAQLLSLVDAREQAVTKANTVKGAARPAYEKALEVMLANNDGGKRNNEIIQAYSYLGSYYALADDKPNAGLYLKKILEIDPSNEYAKSVLDSLKIKY